MLSSTDGSAKVFVNGQHVDVDRLLPVVEGLAGGSLSADDREEIAKLDAFVLEASRGGETTTLTGFLQLND